MSIIKLVEVVSKVLHKRQCKETISIYRRTLSNTLFRYIIMVRSYLIGLLYKYFISEDKNPLILTYFTYNY